MQLNLHITTPSHKLPTKTQTHKEGFQRLCFVLLCDAIGTMFLCAYISCMCFRLYCYQCNRHARHCPQFSRPHPTCWIFGAKPDSSIPTNFDFGQTSCFGFIYKLVKNDNGPSSGRKWNASLRSKIKGNPNKM